MIARDRGHIVNTASFAGLFPCAWDRLPYVASKAAMVAVMEPDEAAVLLTQAVEMDRFFVVTDDQALKEMQLRASDPSAYIKTKLA